MSDITKAIESMNKAFYADPAAIYALVNNRVPCNAALADHPTVPVETIAQGDREAYMVGALGLLNGVVKALTGKHLAVKLDDTPDSEGRYEILGFTEYTGD